MTRVLIAGAGVAAVECVLALRDLAGSAVEIELLAPAGELVYRPASVVTPFGADAAPRIDLSGLDVAHRHDALAEVSPATHEVLTRDGDRVPYDRLMIATGAHSRDAVTGAVTFRGPLSAGAMERVLARATADPELRVAFAAPAGATWPLPLYELALLSAAALRERGVDDPDLTVVTAEARPLAALGSEASDAVLAALDGAGIDVVAGAGADAAVEGALRLHDGRVVGADVVVALPVVVGPRIPGLPHDADGFLEIDEHGRVRGCDDVFAAGDATACPVKHGSLAAAQADAVAETIAGVADPAPVRPLLQGMLLTGADPLYIRAELGGAATVTAEPLWSPPAKIVGRYLTPFLAAV
ncbi:MAG TPA: FAD-dependent oxidoreductase [Solirubrobacteraceae bacterium]|nr:FAD-dependent oxidoreductase [Solirubrobacteraceae bacterium]